MHLKFSDRLLLLIILPIFLSLALLSYLVTEPLFTPTALITPKAYFPRYIAHKSMLDKHSTGNSISSIKEVLTSDVDGLEIDVRFSKDKIPFLYHADLLEDLTDGKGRPENFNWQELQQLSYKTSHKDKLVKLEEVFQLIGSKKYCFLDIKSDKWKDTEFVKAISALIHRYHLQETVVVESLNPFFLIRMRLEARDVLVMYDLATNTKAEGQEIQTQFDKIPWILKQPFFQKQMRRLIRPDLLGPRYNVDKTTIKNLAQRGYPIIAWTVDSPAVARDLFALGVVGVETNEPVKMLQTIGLAQASTYDAGGSTTTLTKMVHVHSIGDIKAAIVEAKRRSIPVSIAGRKHSMGGQTHLKGSIQLDMLRFNDVTYDPKTKTVTAQAGATWKKVQEVLTLHGRSVKVMQSDNIFTVGGSLGVNVHGWQAGAGPLSSAIKAMKVITADGQVRVVSLKENAQLFKAIVGGYGQLGVIVEAEIETVPNSLLNFHVKVTNPKDYANFYEQLVTKNPKAELAYGRLSLDKHHLFEEAILCWYENERDQISAAPLVQEPLIAFKRTIFRFSEYGNWGKKLRWFLEKKFSERQENQPPNARNNIMNTDTHILWPLYGQSRDILQEYFVPKDKVAAFTELLKKSVKDCDLNLLNVTIREVRKDTISYLPYAKTDVFGFVPLFSQPPGEGAEEKLSQATEHLIDGLKNIQGSFYLPYQLHYRFDQFMGCYPGFDEWLKIKQKWDPQIVFDSEWMRHKRKQH